MCGVRIYELRANNARTTTAAEKLVRQKQTEGELGEGHKKF